MAGSGTAQLRGGDPLLRVENLVVEFPAGRGSVVHAVSDVSFDVMEGETLGLVGESGCGKSTTARAVIQLPRPTGGTVDFEGRDLVQLGGEALRAIRPEIQMIFQDPISSLNPRRRVFDIVSEGVKVWSPVAGEGTFSSERVEQIIRDVGLDPEVARHKRAHEYSGGQCQRISIGRALVLDPKLIVCDEPVSALDVSVQAQILNLLEDMKARYGLTLLFISHDLSVVKHISDRVAVMYLGKLCEIGDADQVFADPAHPYTRVLMSAIPDPENPLAGAVEPLSTELPSPIDPPPGCRFHTRCPKAQHVCRAEEPRMEQVGRGDHFVACHFPETETPVGVG